MWDGSGEEEAFRRSKKMVMSPDISGGTGNGMAIMLKEIMREELKLLREEIRKKVRVGIEKYGDMVRKEMEEIKVVMRKREEEWNKDREVLKESMREIEKRVREIEVEGGREVVGEEGGGRGGKELEKKVKELERRWELKERRKNIAVKEIMW